MSNNDYISRPTIEGLWEYLTYQFPETRGHIPLAEFCKKARLDFEKLENDKSLLEVKLTALESVIVAEIQDAAARRTQEYRAGYHKEYNLRCEETKLAQSWKDMAQKLAYHVNCYDSQCGRGKPKCEACQLLESFKRLDAPAEPSNADLRQDADNAASNVK